MSESTYKQHPLWALVSQLESLSTNEAFNDNAVAQNAQNAFSRDKIFATTKTIKAYLSETPAILASIHGMNQISGALQNVVNEVNAFISNKNLGHLTNAAAHIDQNVLPQLWAFLPTIDSTKPSAISEIAKDLRESALKTIEELNSQKKSIEADLSSLKDEISTHKQKISELTDAVATQKAEALAVTAQVQKLYSEEESNRNIKFSEIINNLRNEFKEFQTSAAIQKSSLISALEESRDQAAKIVQVVGNIGATGNYQKIANSESAQANLWRWITVALFLVGIATAVATFVKFWGEPMTPENAWSAIIRLLYAMAITAPAWYAARESARHRTNSDRARQTELELASLGPFIELMPDEKKFSIREELVKRYFGNSSIQHEIKEPAPIKEMKELAIEAIKAASK